jgi:hypothetical protein
MKKSQIRSGQPIDKLGRVIDILKQALAPMPEAVPTVEQYHRWQELLKRQRTAYLQREAQQYTLNNEIYELALLDTPVDIKVLNDDLDVLLTEGHPYKSTKTPTVKQKSDEPTMLVEYTLNHQENLVLNNIAAELMEARRNSIISHGRRQSERKMEAPDKTDEPKSRRDKRR